MNKEELLFDDIYNQTQDFGRTQFVREIMKLQQKVNQLEMSIATKDSELLQLKEELRQLKANRDEVIEYAKGYFTKAISFNPYVVIEKLERGKE